MMRMTTIRETRLDRKITVHHMVMRNLQSKMMVMAQMTMMMITVNLPTKSQEVKIFKIKQLVHNCIKEIINIKVEQVVVEITTEVYKNTLVEIMTKIIDQTIDIPI